MADIKEILIDWLRDAHAMEASTAGHLEDQIDHLDHYPQLRDRYRQHAELSRRQAQQLEQCLSKLGADTSTLKDAMTKLVGKVQLWSAGVSADEVVKQAAGTYAYQYFEIGNYRALVGAAQMLGDTELVRVFETAISDQQAMADWLEQNIPDITRTYLQARASGAPIGAAKS